MSNDFYTPPLDTLPLWRNSDPVTSKIEIGRAHV